MLSFFLKKKRNPDAQEEIIQGPSDASSNDGASDFVFIEKKSNGDPTHETKSFPMYPPLPSGFGGTSNPSLPYPPGKSQSTTLPTNQMAVPYVQGVPFVLAPQLRIKTIYDLTQTQVDGVLALLTRQMSVDEKDDYNFTLERSLRN